MPDRLIDELVAAYNDRDLEVLRGMARAQRIEDTVAAAYADDSSFEDVTEWAQAGWDADDRIRLVGYGYHPTKRAFQMYVTRSSAALREQGIERVAASLDATSKGCIITSLSDTGPIQARERPCAFYNAFGAVTDIASDEPQACVEGWADHARSDPAAVFTGEKVIVWGGDRGGLFRYFDVAMDGLTYEPESRQWGRVPVAPLPPIWPHVEAWTGREMIVVGAKIRGEGGVGAAAYHPSTRRWRTLEPPPRRWGGFGGVWTGRELLLWGGPEASEDPFRRALRYNPATDSWRKTALAPVVGRWSHAVVWTGTEMIVWGGGNATSQLGDGAAYDPVTDEWRKLAPAPFPPREETSLLWTGHEVIMWGGSSVSRSVATGAAYNPSTDSWRTLPESPLAGRHYHSLVWTGREVIVFGGYDYDRSFADGAAYDPAANVWRKLPGAPFRPRSQHAAIWTGSEMIVFGGEWESGHIALGDGGSYNPVTNRWRRLVPPAELSFGE